MTTQGYTYELTWVERSKAGRPLVKTRRTTDRALALDTFGLKVRKIKFKLRKIK